VNDWAGLIRKIVVVLHSLEKREPETIFIKEISTYEGMTKK